LFYFYNFLSELMLLSQSLRNQFGCFYKKLISVSQAKNSRL